MAGLNQLDYFLLTKASNFFYSIKNDFCTEYLVINCIISTWIVKSLHSMLKHVPKPLQILHAHPGIIVLEVFVASNKSLNLAYCIFWESSNLKKFRIRLLVKAVVYSNIEPIHDVLKWSSLKILLNTIWNTPML